MKKNQNCIFSSKKKCVLYSEKNCIFLHNKNCILSCEKNISQKKKSKKYIGIDKWDFENIETKNKLLETKIKKNDLILNHLSRRKPFILNIKKRKEWHNRITNLLNEQEELRNELHQTHIALEKILPNEKEED